MRTLHFLFLLSIVSTSLAAQSSLLKEIRNVSSDSLIMEDVSYLSDLYGPRFIGTPKYFESVLYLQNKLDEIGITTRLESFDNGFRGWDFSDFNVQMSAPTYAQITAYPLAFSSSTDGTKTAELVFINSLKDAYDLSGKLENKIIMLEALYHPVSNVFAPMATILSDEILDKARANPDPNDIIIGYHSRRSVPGLFKQREATKQRMAEFFTFLKDEGVIAVIEPSNSPYGILHADGNRSLPSFNFVSDIKPIASFVMANEDFGRLLRLQQKGFKPKLEVRLKAIYYEHSLFNQQLIAEIEGSDSTLKDELVLIGAHLDSWHAGTGAVDNASNSAVLVEVMRILKTINARTKRTVRLVLWGGEEHVFAGSKFYLNQHVADMITGDEKPDKKLISCYLNLDNGAGKIRGIYLMGNEKIEPYFAEYLQPFDSGNTLTLQNANQTDHWLFDYHNIPAFQFIQEPLDYISAVHHTSVDKYEYVPRDAQKYNAELVAYLVHQIGNERGLMPRKPFNFITPSRSGNVTFSLKGFEEAIEVSLVGDFNNWDMFNIPLYKVEGGWETKINLPTGKYYYKFIVDEYWTSNPETNQIDLVKDGKGHGGLSVMYVE